MPRRFQTATRCYAALRRFAFSHMMMPLRRQMPRDAAYI